MTLDDSIPIPGDIPETVDSLQFRESVGMDLDKFERFKLYVDPNGSNSNDGLSADKPLRTLEAATYAIPGLGFTNFSAPVVDIVLTAGATYQLDTTYFPFAWLPKIRLAGDATTPPTIEVAGGGDGIWVDYAHLEFDDVNLAHQTGATPNRLVKARYGAQVGFTGCTLDASAVANEAVDALYNSFVNADSTTTVNGPGKGSKTGFHMHSSSHLRLDGTVDSFRHGVWIDRNATLDGIGTSVTNNSYGIRAEDNAAGKLVNAASLADCASGVWVVDDGFMQVDGDTTLTNVGTVINREGGAAQAPDGLFYSSSGKIYAGGSGTVGTAPTYQEPGDMAVSDGVNWDPDGDGFSELVTWDGSAWQEVHDYGSAI